MMSTILTSRLVWFVIHNDRLLLNRDKTNSDIVLIQKAERFFQYRHTSSNAIVMRSYKSVGLRYLVLALGLVQQSDLNTKTVLRYCLICWLLPHRTLSNIPAICQRYVNNEVWQKQTIDRYHEH